MKKYYKEFTLMKGIGILLVILGHSFSFTGFNLLKDNVINKYIYNTIYSFHMPLFFMIAGFLSNSSKNNLSKKYYFSKTKRLLVPYIFINIVDVIPRRIFINFVNNKSNNLERIVFYSGIGTWFIYTLFILFLIFPVIEKFILKKDKYYLFGAFLFLLNYYKLGYSMKLFTIDRLVYMSFYFYIGYLIKNHYEFIKLKNIDFKIYLLIFLFCSYRYSESSLSKILFPFLGITITWLCALKLNNSKKMNKFICFCGQNSLSFYLLENFLGTLYRVILIKFIPIKYDGLLVISFFLLKVITIYYLLKFILIKMKITALLFGGRYERSLD